MPLQFIIQFSSEIIMFDVLHVLYAVCSGEHLVQRVGGRAAPTLRECRTSRQLPVHRPFLCSHRTTAPLSTSTLVLLPFLLRSLSCLL